MRWCFRLVIPAIMVLWGTYELIEFWNDGWIWRGYRSAIAFFVGLYGLLWLIEDLQEFVARNRNRS